MTPTKPTHKLKAFNKLTGKSAEVGAAWANADGTINVHINPFVTLEAKDHFAFILFPADGSNLTNTAQKKRRTQKSRQQEQRTMEREITDAPGRDYGNDDR